MDIKGHWASTMDTVPTAGDPGHASLCLIDGRLIPEITKAYWPFSCFLSGFGRISIFNPIQRYGRWPLSRLYHGIRAAIYFSHEVYRVIVIADKVSVLVVCLGTDDFEFMYHSATLHHQISSLLNTSEMFGSGLLIPILLAVSAAILVARRLRLNGIPGPFFAAISYIPRLKSVAKGSNHLDALDLHKTYGSVVRVGPNHVSFSDGEALTQVYSAYTKFEKSDFYLPFDASTPHGFVPTVFSVRSEHAHRGIKRPIAGAYSMTTLLELEALTDECIAIFQEKIDEKIACSSKRSIELDLGEWLHWYAFDLITSITFSNRLGFMTQERDVEGIIEAIEGRLKYNATIGQAPFLHKFLLGNVVIRTIANCIPSIAKLNTATKIVNFAAQQIKRYEGKDREALEYRDMLDRFRRTKSDGELQMTDLDVLLAAVGNIFAGSDTTAISLRATFYYLARNPHCLEELLKEIKEKDNAGKLSPIVTFSESQDMPYLQACLKEAMRMHPAVGLMLERIVPEGGITISGNFIPAGTVIGANPWVVARDKRVYGHDAENFRPERWLDLWRAAESGDEQADIAKDRLKQMERNFLAFGTGSRSCLGKNVSLLEMNKLVPQVLRRYHVELVNPEESLKVENYWFAKQVGLVCAISPRE